MAWRWDKRAARYRDDVTGRFMSDRRVRRLVQQSLDASRAATGELARLVSNSELAPAAWRDMMRQEIKAEYIREYLAGRGGRSVMTQADWGRIGGMLREQYRYLERFTAQVAAGDLSEGQIRLRQMADSAEPADIVTISADVGDFVRAPALRPQVRAQMYANSAREAFHRAERVSKEAAGYAEERRVTTAAESCPDCRELAARGWQPIGSLPQPGDGSTVCLTNCQCYKEYRISGRGSA